MRLQITELKRPIIDDRKLSEHQFDPEAMRLWQEQREAEHADFLSEWTPPRAPIVTKDDDYDFELSNIESAAFGCWKLRKTGHVAAATAPCWVNRVEMWLVGLGSDERGILAQSDTAVSLILPFLMQGGEFHVTFETEKHRDEDGEISTWLARSKRIRVRTADSIHSGELIRECGEMQWEVVKLPNGTPQAVADAVATAYTAIDKLDLPQDYPAVLPLQGHCAHCHRPLTDPVSKVLGLGPDCAARFRVPHNAAAVNHILAKRQAFLASLARVSEPKPADLVTPKAAEYRP